MAPEISTETIKLNILRMARKHFARDGLVGASLKQIAEDSNVASSLINYHFTDREGLFHSCLRLFAVEKQETINRILVQVKSKEEFRVRLEMFADEMIRSHLEDPDGFEIIHREVKANNPKVLKLFKETIFQGFICVSAFLESAKRIGILRKDVDPNIASMLLFTSICDTARNDHLAQKFLGESLREKKWRDKVSQQIVDLFMKGIAS